METSLEIISLRTHLGSWAYGHRDLETGDTFLTLSSEAPPVLKLLPTGQGVDLGGREWP